MPFKLGLTEQISQGAYPDNYLDLSSQGIIDTEAVQLATALQASRYATSTEELSRQMEIRIAAPISQP